MQFSLFYFSAESAAADGALYQLLVDGATFADRHGLTAVWTPERHFGRFGGIYPNPSVLGAALAAITRRIDIRAGSVVAPLHDPIRIAEEWAVVDNLSGGRVGISFAVGWAPNDFALAPELYETRRSVLLERIDTVRRLWRGESIRVRSGLGGEIDVVTAPRPVQPELRFWLASGGSGARTETATLAGRLGGNFLTHMVSQEPADLAARIEAYRSARAAAGHDPGTGLVTLMLHTFVCDDIARHTDRVRARLAHYVNESLNLRLAQDSTSPDRTFTDRQRHAMQQIAVTRLLENASLIGSQSECAARVARLAALGVDEIACLIDFGLDHRDAMAGLEGLVELQAAVNGATSGIPDGRGS